MIFTAQSDESTAFKLHLGKMLQSHASGYRIVRLSKHVQVYAAGERDDNVYFIESGSVKLLCPTLGGNEGLVAVYGAGDLFGESCLSGETARSETAIALEESTLMQIPRDAFLAVLGRDSLLMSIAQYLINRIAERQKTIASLLEVNREHKLALALLHLGRQVGRPDPAGMRIAQKVCRRELAAMTGTTRPRAGMFLRKFEQLGLVKRRAGGYLVIDELKVHGYLELIALHEGISPNRVQ